MLKIVILLVGLAFVLRILFIFQGAVSFHYDMSRDAYEAQQIWKDHELKLLGPPTTTPGLFSGVLYFYLLSIAYGLSSGDPRIAAIFMSFLNSLAILPIFLLAKDVFKSTRWAFLSGLLFAFSFEAIQYGPWLSNPSPTILTIAVFFYSLRLWQKGHKWGLPLAAFFASISAQFELFLIFLLIVIIIFKFVFKLKISIKQFALSVAIASLTLSTYLIATIKFKTFGLVTGGFLTIFQNTEFSFRIKFTELLFNYINRFSDLFINNFFPTNVFIGGSLGFAVLFILIFKSFNKEKDTKKSYVFILFCLLCNLLIFIFGGQNATYTSVGMVVPAILGILVLLQSIFQVSRVLGISLIAIVIVSNLYMTLKLAPSGQIALVIPKDMVLSKQLKLIDTTYKVSNGEQFSINTLTLPLWTNTTWAYLYSWYGKNKYGYVPSFYGRDQIGLLGEKDLQKIDKPQELSFLIIEPHEGIPVRFYDSEIEDENSRTNLEEEIKFGDLKLQVRTPKNEE